MRKWCHHYELGELLGDIEKSTVECLREMKWYLKWMTKTPSPTDITQEDLEQYQKRVAVALRAKTGNDLTVKPKTEAQSTGKLCACVRGCKTVVDADDVYCDSCYGE